MAQRYIEVKGPFQIRSSEAASKVGAEVLRLAKKHPYAKFILRESTRTQGSGSAYSAAFKTLTANKMGDRIHVVKAEHGRGRLHLGPPSKVREAKIKKLNAFHVAEFTFSGKVPSAEYKAWGEVDKSISKEKTWDPLRSKARPTSFGFSRRPKDVKKYVGGTSSATKKIDALIDRVSEYGRRQGARQGSVDVALEYIRDKSDEFAETQRYNNPSVEPIHMLSQERLTRLDRLQKNYGTSQVQTGKVNIAGGGQKKIVPQVPIQTDSKKLYSSNVTTSSKASLPLSALKRWKGRVQNGKIELPESHKGLPGTGHRESGTSTSFDPVGVSNEIDSAREFDNDAVMSKKDDAPRYPTQSSDRAVHQADQKPLKNVKPVSVPDRKAKFAAGSTTNLIRTGKKNTTQFPFISESTGKNLIVNEFSKLTSGLTQWDKHKGELDSSHSITPSDEFKKSSFESPDIASADKGGGGNMQTHTDEYIDTKAQGMADDMANIEKQPWLIDSVTVGDTKKATKTTTMTDVLYGDGQSKEYNPTTGTQDKAPSSTSPSHVGDPIEPYKKKLADLPPGVRKTKKTVSPERKLQQRISDSGNNIEIKKNAKGQEYVTLKKHTDGLNSNTRAKQIQQNYVEFRNKAIKDFNVKKEAGETTSKIVTSDKTSVKVTKDTHSPQRTFSLKKKATVKGTSAGSIIRKGFGLAGIASIAIAPILAVREVQAANKKLTPANVGQETVRFMVGSDRVWSGVGAKNKGYFQKVGVTTPGVDGRRRVNKPIKGAGGPDTPYAKLKKSISGAMIQWSNASSKATEALKYRSHR